MRQSLIPLSSHWEEREGPAPKAWEGEVGMLGVSPTSPNLSSPRGGEG